MSKIIELGAKWNKFQRQMESDEDISYEARTELICQQPILEKELIKHIPTTLPEALVFAEVISELVYMASGADESDEETQLASRLVTGLRQMAT
jgi:hypothetical protein